jgi:sec-independent protein translocase protein TatB
MFSNIGGLEVLFVAMLALIVLGPTKLPEAARQVGKFVSEIRRISGGFQKEFREAVQDPIVEAEARARGNLAKAKMAVDEPFKSVIAPTQPAKKPTTDKAASSSSDTSSSSESSASDNSSTDSSASTPPKTSDD